MNLAEACLQRGGLPRRQVVRVHGGPPIDSQPAFAKFAGLGALRFLHPSALSGLSHQSGGSIVCSLRIVISAFFGEGKPTEMSVFSNSSLDHRVRMLSSESQTPTM